VPQIWISAKTELGQQSVTQYLTIR